MADLEDSLQLAKALAQSNKEEADEAHVAYTLLSKEYADYLSAGNFAFQFCVQLVV